MKKLLFLFLFLPLFFGISKAHATTLFTENFDDLNLGYLDGQGEWSVASPSGATKFELISSPVFSAPRSLRMLRTQNQVLPIAIEHPLPSIPTTEIVNLAFNLRFYTPSYVQKITVVDSNNYPICSFGQRSPSSTTVALEIPYTELSVDYSWTVGDYTTYGSGITTGIWYYPIIRMNFDNRTCSLSMDSGMSWSGDLQLYSEAGVEGSTIEKVIITHPETSTSPSYGSYTWYIDGMTMWTGGVAGSGGEVGDIDLSTFSATNSGYLTYDLSGDVGYVSGNLTTCEVDVFQQDVYNNSPMFYQAGNGFEGTIILWNTNLVDYTQIFPNNVYIGHGYSEESSAWEAEGFKVHYYGGQNTNLKFDYTCYENYGTGNDIQVYHTQGVNPADPDFNSSLVASPAGLLNAPSSPTDSYCGDDWFCAIKQWFISTVQWFFVPQKASIGNINAIALEVRTNKMPWCYVSQILSITEDLQQEDSATISAVSWNFSGVELLPDSLKTGSQNLPSAVSNLLGIVKGFFSVVVWAGLLIYLVTRFRNGII